MTELSGETNSTQPESDEKAEIPSVQDAPAAETTAPEIDIKDEMKESDERVIEFVCPICDRMIPHPPPEFCPHCSAHLQIVKSIFEIADRSIAEAARDISIGEIVKAEQRLQFVETVSKRHRTKVALVRAQILRLKGYPDKALENLNAVKDSLDPDDRVTVEMHSELTARCIKDQSDLASCCEHYNFALFQAKRGHFEEARESLAKALEIVPHHTESHALMGKVLMAMRDENDARYHLNRALATDPTNVSAMRTLSKMKWAGVENGFRRIAYKLNMSPPIAGSVFVVLVLILIAIVALLSRG
ncbi:MAG TPA: tetratricopeptide repeat protein [Firmicutes bacterium]|nr:tetratricopeptide repeat protein [Bacillota bacterium]